MPGKFFKDYFSFTRKERIGVLVLVLVTFIVFLVPYLLPEKKENINPVKLQQFKEEIAKLSRTEQTAKTYPDPDKRSGYSSEDSLQHRRGGATNFEKYHFLKGDLFYFDPNTLTEKGWARLGLREKTISTIQNYLSKGGKFRRSEDLGKIYGLHKSQLEQLLPYVKINALPERANKPVEHNFLPKQSYPPNHVKFTSSVSDIIDINSADTTQLIALPGIGSKLAARIVNFREKLGGFYAVDQLSDVYGLPDSTFQKLRSRLTVSVKSLRLVNINTARAEELRQLPYIQWNLANAIVEFRKRHGSFTSTEDLLQIELFTPAMLKKIAPYLVLQ